MFNSTVHCNLVVAKIFILVVWYYDLLLRNKQERLEERDINRWGRKKEKGIRRGEKIDW